MQYDPGDCGHTTKEDFLIMKSKAFDIQIFIRFKIQESHY